MIKKNFVKNELGISPLRIFVILFVLIVIVALIWFVMATREISCSPDDKVSLTGVFKGYYFCQNFSGYTVIVINNDSYIFKRGLDTLYLNNLLGHDVEFQCCRRTSSSQYQPETYFDFLSGVIIME